MHLIRIYIIITIIKYIRRFFCTAIKGMFSMVYRKYSNLLRTLGEANSTSSETGCTLLTTKAEIAILFHDGCAPEKKFMRKKMSSFFQVC